jgi:hypothetical protein
MCSNELECRRCQTKHGTRNCPAFGKKCSKCGILNYFAKSCRVRQIREIQCDKSESTESLLYCDGAQFCVGSVETEKHCNIINVNVKVWREVITIEDKRINIKLDTGAEVSIIPLNLFNKINKQFNVRPTNVMLVIPR